MFDNVNQEQGLRVKVFADPDGTFRAVISCAVTNRTLSSVEKCVTSDGAAVWGLGRSRRFFV